MQEDLAVAGQPTWIGRLRSAQRVKGLAVFGLGGGETGVGAAGAGADGDGGGGDAGGDSG